MQDFLALERKERVRALENLGEPPFRERQIFQWLCRGADSFSAMRDLPASLRASLVERYELPRLNIETVQQARDGTRKYLLGLSDGNRVEAVCMRYRYGTSICLSTQVGCRMGCRFCASTIGGRVRDLLAWEMLAEYLLCRQDTGSEIRHVVLMGIGEPFDNYDNVAEFLRQIHDPAGVGLSYRAITVSTCGKVPEIERFGDEFPQVNLAVSLHAASQKEREAIMPIALRYDLPTLLSACRAHSEKTGRRITFEYALIAGKNDSLSQADRLADLLSGLLCHVNLIPLNPVAETGLSGSDKTRVRAFSQRLQKRGIPVTVRRTLGPEIEASCGQLRRNSEARFPAL